MKKSRYIFKQAKCELKTPSEHEEIKRTNGVKFKPNDIVYGVN
jgi:hypothetical protein